MKLILIQGWTGDEMIISDNASEEIISQLVHSLDWKQFHFIHLEKDITNWLSVSGNISKDGLAIVYEANGETFVSNTAPEKISQLENVLLSFYNGDNQFKKFGYSSANESTGKNGYSLDYDQWKMNYEAKKKKDKKNHLKAIGIAFIVISFVSYFLYLLYSDNLQFVGHTIEETEAIVIDTEVIRAYRGRKQLVTYQFTFNEEIFRGNFIVLLGSNRLNVDDRVKIKFASDDPTISEKIATLKKKSGIRKQLNMNK
jgi:hypothetical protein